VLKKGRRALRLPLASGFRAVGLLLSLSIAFSLIDFLLDRVAIITGITQLRRNTKLIFGDQVDEAKIAHS